MSSETEAEGQRDKECGRPPVETKFPGIPDDQRANTAITADARSVQRLKERIREITRIGRGRNDDTVIEEISEVLRGWSQRFTLAE